MADRNVKIALTADIQEYVEAIERARKASRKLTKAMRKLNESEIAVRVRRVE